MTTRTVSKREAATEQLEASIKLFFEDRNFICACTLAAAANGILEGIWKNEGGAINQRRIARGKPFAFSLGEEWDMAIKDEYKTKGWHWKLLHKNQNFFKHADLDHDEEHEFHESESTGLEILTSIANYNLVFDVSTPAMSSFTTWYFLVHPDLMKKDAQLASQPGFEKASNEVKALKEPDKFTLGLNLLKKCCPELFHKHSSVASVSC